MTEERSDWKVKATLDRDALVEDIVRLVEILKRQRVYCIVSARDAEEAKWKGSDHIDLYMNIPPRYVKAMHPRRMPR